MKKHLLKITSLLALTCSYVIACPDVTEELFDEVSQSTQEKLSAPMKDCGAIAPCSYHSEAVMYTLRHGSFPENGLTFYPKILTDEDLPRSPAETALSYMSFSSEPRVKINGVSVPRGKLLSYKLDLPEATAKSRFYKLSKAHWDYAYGELRIPQALDVIGKDSAKIEKTLDILQGIEKDNPFILSVHHTFPDGQEGGHAMPAIKLVDGVSGKQKY